MTQSLCDISTQWSNKARLGVAKEPEIEYNGFYGIVAQLVRASPCHGEGRGFESRRFRHRKGPTSVGLFLWFNVS